MKELTANSEKSSSDVLVLFPSAKNFPTNYEVNSPVSDLKQEVEKRLDLTSSSCLESNPQIQGLSQINDSLEVRLKVLEEINTRLKFYLDDIESNLERN